MRVSSWVVSRKSDGAVIGEFFDYRNVCKFDPSKVVIESSYVYLCRLNALIRAGLN
jgi:hypothetical protein